MKVAIFQPRYPAAGTLASATECMDWMSAELTRLSPGDADLVLLPEYANTPGLDDPALLRTCAGAQGAGFLRRMAATAARLQCLVATGVIAGDQNHWFNRTVVFGPAGDIVFHYDKVHLTEAEETHLGLTPGSDPTVYVHQGVRLGFATCFDLYFPEHFVALASHRPDLILCPSYQRSESAERIRTLAQVRALDAGSYVIRSSYAILGASTGGRSLVAAPDGTILIDAAGTVGVEHIAFDPHRKFTKPASHGRPAVEHRALIEARRRPETYRRLD